MATLAAASLASAEGEDSSGPPYAHRPLDVSDEVGYYIDPPRKSLHGLPGDAELALWAIEAWDAALFGMLCAVPRRPSAALIRVYWGQIEGGLGRMQTLESDRRRASEVYVQTDLERFDPLIGKIAEADPLLRDAIVYRTLLHEIGHALGLVHSLRTEDAMYFGGDVLAFYRAYRRGLETRRDIRYRAGLSETDKDRVRALYAGAASRRPVNPEPAEETDSSEPADPTA